MRKQTFSKECIILSLLSFKLEFTILLDPIDSSSYEIEAINQVSNYVVSSFDNSNILSVDFSYFAVAAIDGAYF